MDGGKLPDPFCIKDGWIGEKEGMRLWPPTLLVDIKDFLGEKIGARLLQDYKERKAYSYFEAGLLGLNINACQ